MAHITEFSWLLQGLTLKRHIEATLGSGNIREAVQLPPGEDLNEWLAVNTVDFYNAISVLYGTLEESCTAQTCPVMSAGPKVLPASSAAAATLCIQAIEYATGRVYLLHDNKLASRLPLFIQLQLIVCCKLFGIYPQSLPHDVLCRCCCLACQSSCTLQSALMWMQNTACYL